MDEIRCPHCSINFAAALDRCPGCGAPSLWKAPIRSSSGASEASSAEEAAAAFLLGSAPPTPRFDPPRDQHEPERRTSKFNWSEFKESSLLKWSVVAVLLAMLFVVKSLNPSTPAWLDAARERQNREEAQEKAREEARKEREENAKQRALREAEEQDRNDPDWWQREKLQRLREARDKQGGNPGAPFKEPLIDRNGSGIDNP